MHLTPITLLINFNKNILLSVLLFCMAFIMLSPHILRGDDLTQEEIHARLDDVDLNGDWVYNNIEEGFKQARLTGKPLMIVFR